MDSKKNEIKSYLEDGEETELPKKLHGRVIRHLRHTIFNVYKRLFSVVFILNMIGAAVLIYQYRKAISSPALLASIANIASANIMVALLIRQDYVVNILFGICWSVPLSTPLRIRRLLAKIYEFGGVHSGAAICSVLWFCLFTSLLTRDFVISNRKSGLPTKDSVVLTITYILLWTLITLTVTAYPRFRIWSHNTFENFHRWGGWFTLALFWVELIIFTILNKDTKPLGIMLVKFPAFWFLTISTIRLHKLHVIPEKLSNHAIRLHFKDKVPNYVGLRISDAPLKEWHSFACIPARDGCGGSLLISNAGDLTEKTVTDPKPYYWVKGVPSTGVLCMAQIFRSVIIVTTGSGIGPCLAVIQDVPARGTKVRVIRSTPDPWHTYGDEICLAVQDVDKNAVIHDTRKYGRPDMVKMAYDMYKEGEAEAVFMISNPKMTKKLVYGLESRGVPAFGPIWDS